MPWHVYIQICTCHRSGFCNKTKGLQAWDCLACDAVSLSRSSWAPSTIADAGTTIIRNVGNPNPATQRDVTQSQAVEVRGSTFSRSRQFIFLSAAGCVQTVATDCDMNTIACNSHTTNSSQLALTALQNESLLAATFKWQLPARRTNTGNSTLRSNAV